MQQPHDSDLLADYLFGDLSPEHASKVEAHIETCAACREFVTLARSFHGGLQRAYKAARPSENETCPDVSRIIALADDKLSESEANEVRAHLLGCLPCMKEFLALERMRPKVVKFTLGVARGAVHCLLPPEEAEWKALVGKAFDWETHIRPPRSALAGTAVYRNHRRGPKNLMRRKLRVFPAPFQVTQLLTDSSGRSSKITVLIRESWGIIQPVVQFETNSEPPIDWTCTMHGLVRTFSTDQVYRQGKSFPLFGKVTALLMGDDATNLLIGEMIEQDRRVSLEIADCGIPLARFEVLVKRFNFEESLRAAISASEDGDYFRTLAFLRDMAGRYPAEAICELGIDSSMSDEQLVEVLGKEQTLVVNERLETHEGDSLRRTREELQARLMATNDEFRQVAAQHAEFHKKLETLEAKPRLTAEDELEEHRLKKQKLRLRDKMNQIIARHLETARKA